jgi:hypothetical protein
MAECTYDALDMHMIDSNAAASTRRVLHTYVLHATSCDAKGGGV